MWRNLLVVTAAAGLSIAVASDADAQRMGVGAQGGAGVGANVGINAPSRMARVGTRSTLSARAQARPDGAATRLEPRQKDRLALPCRHTRLHAIRLALTQRSYGRTTSFSKKAPAGRWSLFVLAANRSRVSLAAL